MRNKRKLQKSKSRMATIIENHINQNKKEYIISVIVFMLGIIIGVIILNSSNQENQKIIGGYINELIDLIKNREYKIDENKLLIKSVTSNLKIALIIWVAGSTIIGMPIIYCSLFYKGICIGYSISAIMATLEKSKGILFALSSMLLQNIIVIPAIIAISVSSAKMYRGIMKEHDKESIKSEIYRHTMFSLIMVVALMMSSLIEIFVSTNITTNFIINFIWKIGKKLFTIYIYFDITYVVYVNWKMKR